MNKSFYIFRFCKRRTNSLKICLIFFITVLLSCAGNGFYNNKKFIGKNGVIDLREWNYHKNTIIDLSGDWEFYWKKLLKPQDFENEVQVFPDGVFRIDKGWKNYTINGKKIGPLGYGTYRTKLILPKEEITISLFIKNIYTSYRLWIDTDIVIEGGHPDTTKRLTKALIKPQQINFTPKKDTVHICLQIANFEYDKGGIIGSGNISIGTSEAIRGKNGRIHFDAFLEGIFFVMALYHIALFFMGKRDLSLIYLAIICLLMLLYTSTTRELLLIQHFPTLPWGIYNRIAGLPDFLLSGFFLLFINTVYPDEVNKKIVRVLLCGSLLFTCIVMIAQQHYSFRIYLVYSLHMILMIVYMINVVIRAALNNRFSAKYLIVVSWTIALAAGNDILNEYGIWSNGHLVPIGGFLFILFCEIGIYERFLQAETFEKKQREKLAETDRLASLGTLIAGIAHEINNPNNSIMLTSQQTKDIWQQLCPTIDEVSEEEGIHVGGFTWEQVKEEITEAFARVIRNARRIERIVTDLKAYARKDMANLMEPVNINAVVNSCVTLLGNKIKNSTDKFTVECAETIPSIKGSFQKLEQVIINLVVNSCEALSDRSKAVHIVTDYDKELRKVTVTVSDEGCGIEPQKIRQIFNPFYSTKLNSGGTGLGLSIAHTIIAGHNGELTISSEVNKGTRAIITLPVTEEKESGRED